MPEIILASQSPRRRMLVENMGITYSAVPSNFEEALDPKRDAQEVAKELAMGKALDVAASNPNAYVIGSDTIVAVNGRQMEKPLDILDAREMLTALSGHESTVSTGIAIVNLSNNVERVEVATTKVFFYPDSPEIRQLRETYLATDDWKDKAGGYGIQSGAASLIQYIEGEYDTVIGLPTQLLAEMLNELGIDAKPVILECPVERR